ncbi:MAG: winged helix-turn-helix domain-containing protein [Vicinamibacterales bacterium]|nr:winged helix-turn-helix domain-containing protein [Vicinamibacterales bacterium]
MLPLERQSDVRRFGTFEVDLRARELRKGGIRIRLQDQPFEILALMLDRPGELLTREELRQRLWPDGTFVDFEHSLNAAVKRLRAALGDDADNPRFVETLHRRGYRFVAAVGADSPARHLHAVPLRSVQQRPEVASVRLVVLPFANLSNDAAQEYFSDGLTEEMITQISRLSPGRLGVIARTSSMLFKRSMKSACEIARELAVDYLLEGSVRFDGDRIRITAQLIEARNETHLWAETYDRRMEETLVMQSEVAARIAHSLAMELVPDQREALDRVAPRRNDAYQAYLKGRYHWNRSGDEGLEPALGFYERAIELDPRFAAAYAALARAKVSVALYSREPGRRPLEDARAAALCALELDPGLPDAHVALAEVRKSLEWNWPLAEAAYRTAIALSPSCETAHRSLGILLASLGRFPEAKVEADRACDLDPLCLTVNTGAAWVRYVAGEFDETIDRCQYTLDMDPGFTSARRLLGVAYLEAGRPELALVELDAAAAQDGTPLSLAWLAHAQAVGGRADEARALVARLDILARTTYVPPYHLAIAQVGLGNRDIAFDLLKKASAERDPALTSIGVDPRLEPLRRDRRYSGLTAEIGIPTVRA